MRGIYWVSDLAEFVKELDQVEARVVFGVEIKEPGIQGVQAHDVPREVTH